MHRSACHPPSYRSLSAAALVLLGALLLLGVPAGPAAAQAVIYVDAGAAPGGDGASWASAFRDLQDALAAAEAGDEIWVAEGVYRPTEGSDRTATFLLASGVALYGGFDGTETSRDERDWTVNVTVLSGDIGVPGDSTDNAYHVVTASGVDRTAVLDGFTIRHGMAKAAMAPDDRGGGLLALGGSPTIRHCVFRLNTAWGIPGQGGEGRGGAVYVEDGSPLVEDVVFEDNRAVVSRGGGLYASAASPELRRVTFRRNGLGALVFADGSAGLVEDGLFEQQGVHAIIIASSPVFHRTTFRDNVTGPTPFEGAGALIWEGSPRFEDCLFENLRTHHNLAGQGGGVHFRWNGGLSHPVFVRTTFRNNTASRGGGASLHPSDALFLHCRFEGNRALAGGGLAGYETAVTVIGSTFVGNRAEPIGTGGSGGGLDLAFAPLLGGRSLVASTLFAGNAGRRGAAANLAGVGAVPVDLVNVTFAGNTAGEGGGALRLRDAAGAALSNVVLWGNGAPVGPEVYVEAGAGPTVERAILAGGCPVGATCTGVLDEDPLFERSPSPGPDGEWGTEDDDYGELRLRAGSPGIDGGLAALLPPDRWDLDGDGDTDEPLPIDVVGAPRVQGKEVDLGAYEAEASSVTVSVASPGRAISVPASGGSFAFRVVLTNAGAEAEVVVLRTGVHLPDGTAVGPLLEHAVEVPAGGQVVLALTQAVPGAAPPGRYRYVAFTGAWPEPLGASDAFPFVKLGAGAPQRDAAAVSGSWSSPVVAVEDGEAASALVPGEALEVHPNPARGTTTVALTLAQPAEVAVALYDVLGRRVAVLYEGRLGAGAHALLLDVSRLPAGVYVARVEARAVSGAERGGLTASRTVTVLR